LPRMESVIQFVYVNAPSNFCVAYRLTLQIAISLPPPHYAIGLGVLTCLLAPRLITAFLVAFAAVTASELLGRIWEYF
jgi:hypothetical protein